MTIISDVGTILERSLEGSDADRVAAIKNALVVLATPYEEESARLSAMMADRRHGARVRAKLEASHGIRARLDATTHAPNEHGNTWRDGYVRGLEDAHTHVQSMTDVDVEDGA